MCLFCLSSLAFQAAVPFEKGEQLGQPLILVRHAMDTYDKIGGVISDVACVLESFLQSRGDKIGVPPDLACALNVLHAKAHPWYCEQIYSLRNKPGGKCHFTHDD